MLRLPLQCEHILMRQGIQVGVSEFRGSRASRVLQLRRKGRKSLGLLHLVKNDELSVGANISWRWNRSCSSGRYRLLLGQQIRGIARDVGSPGLLLEPVSYVGGTTAPALERNDRVLSPAGIDEDERFLSALVANSRLRQCSQRNGILGRGVKEESSDSKKAAVDGRAVIPKQAKNLSSERQTWRLHMEGMRSSDEQQLSKREPNSERLRGLEEMILYLESIGVDATKVLAVYPLIIKCSMEKLKQVVEFLESQGLKRKDVGRVLTMAPQISSLAVEKHLCPVVSFLLNEVGLNKQDLRKVIRRCPRLLVASIDNQLRPTMEFLQSLGFGHMASAVANNATLLTFGIQNKLKPKLKFLYNLGMSYAEAETMVVRFPAIFNYGVEQNLQPKYDYLVNVMGRNLDDLKAFPQYFGYSLDYRIRPRHELLAQRNIKICLPTMLKLSDEQFELRFKEDQAKSTKKLKLAMVAKAHEVNHKVVAVPSCR